MDNNPAVILEDSAFFSKGQVLENYVRDEDGILVEGKLVPEGKFVVLNEVLTSDEEAKIKLLIRDQLKQFLYRLYTYQSTLLNN